MISLEAIKNYAAKHKALGLPHEILEDGTFVLDEDVESEEVTIPDVALKIQGNCNQNVKIVRIGNNVKKIDEAVFASCKSLKEIELPSRSSIESIGRRAFANCVSLEKVILNGRLKNISEDAFWSCTSLKEIVE